MVDPGVLAFVSGALPAAPARVLEIGAGSGELAAALVERGYDVVAIDPASEGPPVVPVPLHELDEPAASFDAAVAVVSLHHVEPLAESCRRLGELMRPGGTLVVDEFDVERYDERAARWWLERHAGGGHDHGRDPAEMVAELREHLHSLGRLRETLGPVFSLEPTVRGAYLHRWELPPGLLAEEDRLIAAGELPATGARFVGAVRGRRAATARYRPPRVRTYVRALGRADSRGRRGRQVARLRGHRGGPPVRRARGARDPLPRGQSQECAEPRARAITGSVRLDCQPLPRMLPCLRLLCMGRHAGPDGRRPDAEIAHLKPGDEIYGTDAGAALPALRPDARCSTTGWFASRPIG